MICKKNIAAFFVFFVLVSSTLFLNGFTLLHKCLLSVVELVAFLEIVLTAKDIKFRGLSCMFVVMFFFFVFNLLLNAFFSKWPLDQIVTSSRESLWWVLVFIFTYVISQLNIIEVNMLRNKMIVAILYLTSLLVIFQCISANQLDFFTSNFAFIPLLLLPFVFLQENSKIRSVGFFLILACVLLSMKRTAIIAYLSVVLGIFISNMRYDRKKKMLASVFYLCLAIFAFYNVNNYLDGNVLYRFSNAAEDGGSGRIEIYSAVINHFSELNFEEQLFGRGHNMVRMDHIFEIKSNGQQFFLSAHNDFIEVLYDYGYFGLIVYFFLLFKVAQSCYFWRNKNTSFYHAMLSSLIITICVSLFSHLIIYPTYFANFSLLWAIMENEKNKLELAYV